jgi:hypothetical protein
VEAGNRHGPLGVQVDMTLGRKVLLWAPIGFLVVATVAAAGVSVTSGRTASPIREWHGVSQGKPSLVPDPNRAAAVSEGQRLIGIVTVPPDWTPASRPPAKFLDTPGLYPATSNLVDQYEWWTTNGAQGAVQGWIVAHPPRGSTLNESGTLSAGAFTSTTTSYAYRPVAGTFSSRQLVFEVGQVAGGRVGIRLDAQVIWYPTRPRSEFIPHGTTRVTATLSRRNVGSLAAPAVVATATFTSPAIVGRLTHKVDTLPLAVPSTAACPEGQALLLDLEFSGPKVRPVVIRDDLAGCGELSFTIGHTVEPPLTDDGLAQEVEQVLR